MAADVGLSPGSSNTAFMPCTLSAGLLHVADAAAAQAQLDPTTGTAQVTLGTGITITLP